MDREENLNSEVASASRASQGKQLTSLEGEYPLASYTSSVLTAEICGFWSSYDCQF